MAFLLVVEGALRLNLVPPVAQLTVRAEAERAEHLLEQDPYVLWRTTPNLDLDDPSSPQPWLRTNRYGFRAPEIASEKPQGVKRIFCLGGSELFGATSYKGAFLDEEHTYPGRLEELLEARGGEWEAINAGMLGQTSLQGLRLLQRDILPLQPDVVVVGYGWNEGQSAHDGKPDAQHRVYPEFVFALRTWIGRHWHTGKAILALRSARQSQIVDVAPQLQGNPSESYLPRVSMTEFAENLAEIVELSTQAGALAVIMPPPVGPLEALAGTGANIENVRNTYILYWQVQRTVAQAAGVPFADANAWIGGRAEFYGEESFDVIHFNGEGHARIAEHLADIIWSQTIESR